jgi:hypothetical protein
MSCGRTIAELLGRWQTGTHRGKGGAADQWALGRMGLGTACTKGILRMKNVLIERFGEQKLSLG